MTRRASASHGSTSPKLPSKVRTPPWRATSSGPSGSPCSSYQSGRPSMSAVGMGDVTWEQAGTHRRVSRCSSGPGVAEAALAPLRLAEGLDDRQPHVLDRLHDELGDPVTPLDRVGPLGIGVH